MGTVGSHFLIEGMVLGEGGSGEGRWEPFFLSFSCSPKRFIFFCKSVLFLLSFLPSFLPFFSSLSSSFLFFFHSFLPFFFFSFFFFFFFFSSEYFSSSH